MKRNASNGPRRLPRLTLSIVVPLLALGALPLLLGGCASESMAYDQARQEAQSDDSRVVAIGASEAESIALEDAGVAEGDLVAMTSEERTLQEGSVFEVLFSTAEMRYSYSIDAKGGAIRNKSFERMQVVEGSEQDNASDASAQSVRDSKESQGQGYISVSEAKEIAAGHAGYAAQAVTFIQVERDTEDGRVVFELEFFTGGSNYEYVLDAQSGSILSWERETTNAASTDGRQESLSITSHIDDETDDDMDYDDDDD